MLFLNFKGSVLRDFLPLFFHDLNTARTLMNMLKYFRIRVSTSPKFIRIFKKLRGVHPTVESFVKKNSAVCITEEPEWHSVTRTYCSIKKNKVFASRTIKVGGFL